MLKESAGLQSLQQYMRMAQKAPNPGLAMSILDQHFGAQDALQRIKKLAPRPILPATPAARQFVAQAAQKIAEALAPQEPEEDHRLRNYAMGAAAAAPFAGMIGQQPVIHDPHLNPDIRRFATMADLSRAAQPGDVLLTTKPKGSVWKSTIQPLSGSEFYHAQPVIGRRGEHGTTLTAGQYDEPEYRRSLSNVRRDAETVKAMSKTQEYPDVMLMRPKKRLSPEQLKAFTDESVRRGRTPYDHVKAPMTWLKEMFLPKVTFGENKRPPVCEGNVCSTLPAMAYERAGLDVLKGKRSQDIFPPDYLRSQAFEPVGVRLKNEYATSPALRKAMPYLMRGGLGAGLAAGTYGVSKDPALAAAPIGAAAGAMGANALAKHLRRGKGLPSLMDFLTQLPELKGKRRARLIGDFAGKSVPATLAGAGLAYGGAKALQHWLANRRATAHAGDETG